MNTRRSTARPLSVCALLAMGAISLAACGNQSGNDVDNSSQAQSSTSAAASSSETTSKKKEADLSVDQSMGGGAAVWQFPVFFSGWKFGQLDQPGAMQLTNDKGGQYTATQSAYPQPLGIAPQPKSRRISGFRIFRQKQQACSTKPPIRRRLQRRVNRCR